MRRSRQALGDLFTLARYFPVQRPGSATFDAWAEGAATNQLTRELLEDGLAQLGPAEQARIPGEFAAAYPQVWQTIVDESGRPDDAVQILLLGAVVAGLEERQRPLDRAALQLLEVDKDIRDDPVESLALVLVAGDLWSMLEAVDAVDSFDRGVSTAALAERLWSDWHEHRLDQLVRRLRARLPVPGFPTASSTIETACEAFEGDDRVGTRLRAELLLDALPAVADAVRLAA